jgi:hypothetical protein
MRPFPPVRPPEEYSQSLASYWSHITRPEYSKPLASYWSHVRSILSLWLPGCEVFRNRNVAG